VGWAGRTVVLWPPGSGAWRARDPQQISIGPLTWGLVRRCTPRPNDGLLGCCPGQSASSRAGSCEAGKYDPLICLEMRHSVPHRQGRLRKPYMQIDTAPKAIVCGTISLAHGELRRISCGETGSASSLPPERAQNLFHQQFIRRLPVFLRAPPSSYFARNLSLPKLPFQASRACSCFC